MEPYKKRGKDGYAGSKESKERISKERMFAKNEIRELLDENEQGDDFQYKHKRKKTHNEQERLERKINWYGTIISREDQQLHGDLYFYNRFRSQMKKLKEQYKEKYGKEYDCR